MQCLSAIRTHGARLPSCTRLRHALPTPLAHIRFPTASLSPRPTASPFSSTAPLAKKQGRPKRDMRIVLIRYFLSHPLTPRPLRFSRLRHLRHWTIHRAYQLFRLQTRRAQESEHERQFNSMRDACEALRLVGEDGLAVRESGYARVAGVPMPAGARDRATLPVLPGVVDAEINVEAAAERQSEVGRLYRIAMEKRGIWAGVPIEYARAVTDTPPRLGWDHAWKR